MHRLLSLSEGGVPTDRMLEECQRTALEAASLTASYEQDLTMEQIAESAQERALATFRGELQDTIVPLGLRNLDTQFKARRGDYILVGARPSMGKTHFLLSIAASIAKTSGPFLLNSIEMKERAIGDRIFAHELSRQFNSTESEMKAASVAVVNRWKGLPIKVDTRSRSLAQITSALRVAKQRDGIVAAGIDYLQLMRLPKAGTREQEVAHISRNLKMLAGDLEAPVVAVSIFSNRMSKFISRMNSCFEVNNNSGS